MKPLAIDLFCGLGGWTRALLEIGYYVVGFDIERHEYDDLRYPGEIVLQDVRTLDGRQFRGAALIVASPPCQAYSYRAMPWTRARSLPPPSNELFDACFRIQREACAASGRHVPLIVENVRGAQKWVGPARGRYGSFYLWGDVPALLPASRGAGIKAPGLDWNARTRKGQCFRDHAGRHAERSGGGVKGWTPDGQRLGKNTLARFGSKSNARKRASAITAMIPHEVAAHIGRVYWPLEHAA